MYLSYNPTHLYIIKLGAFYHHFPGILDGKNNMLIKVLIFSEPVLSQGHVVSSSVFNLIFPVYLSMAGVSRSTTIVAAYIMAVTQLNWRDAIKAIKCSRSIANPNYGFQRQLQDFYNLQASKVHVIFMLIMHVSLSYLFTVVNLSGL